MKHPTVTYLAPNLIHAKTQSGRNVPRLGLSPYCLFQKATHAWLRASVRRPLIWLSFLFAFSSRSEKGNVLTHCLEVSGAVNKSTKPGQAHELRALHTISSDQTELYLVGNFWSEDKQKSEMLYFNYKPEERDTCLPWAVWHVCNS